MGTISLAGAERLLLCNVCTDAPAVWPFKTSPQNGINNRCSLCFPLFFPLMGFKPHKPDVERVTALRFPRCHWSSSVPIQTHRWGFSYVAPLHETRNAGCGLRYLEGAKVMQTKQTFATVPSSGKSISSFILNIIETKSQPLEFGCHLTQTVNQSKWGIVSNGG